MRRRNPKASQVPAGYVRRTGPTSCAVGVMPGMHVEDLRRMQLAGRFFPGVLPYKVDVSWALWARFIEENHQWKAPEAYSIPGDCLMPDDAAAFLNAMAAAFPLNTQHPMHARTY